LREAADSQGCAGSNRCNMTDLRLAVVGPENAQQLSVRSNGLRATFFYNYCIFGLRMEEQTSTFGG